MHKLFTATAAAALAAATLAAAMPAAAQTIDSFDGAYDSQNVYFNSAAPSQSLLELTVAAAVPGGTRRLQLGADTAALGTTTASINGGGELWAFATGSQRTSFNFAYGTQTAMNLDLSVAGALRLDVYLSTPMKLVVYASTQTTPGGDPNASSMSIDLPSLFNQGLDIPLSGFSPNSSTGLPVNWADVDGLAFFVSANGPMQTGSDAFWVRDFSAVAVPEPSSAALLAVGIAGFLGWRRHLWRAV